MKSITLLLCLFTLTVFSQNEYEPSETFPFGQPHPDAPEQIKDFQPMIGMCDCKSELRNQDGSWNDAIDMTWEFKYIMNGKAVQDQTWSANGRQAGSIRQYIADSSRWYVHFYSSAGSTTVLPTWEGNLKKDEGKIILYREQKAPNGMEGYYRITFYDMNDSGYKWIGEWVNPTETIIYPTWKIACTRRKM